MPTPELINLDGEWQVDIQVETMITVTTIPEPQLKQELIGMEQGNQIQETPVEYSSQVEHLTLMVLGMFNQQS